MTGHGGSGGTIIRLTRSGGLAGLNLVASVEVDDLPTEIGVEVRSALAGLKSPPTTAGPPHPHMAADLFQYDLVVETGGERRAFTADDGSLSPAARALVDVLLPLARPE